MRINITTNKNFTTQYNRMQAKYGTEMAHLNGFDDNQLSYTDFIDNFIDNDTVADASIDGNANVGHKDILTLLNEMPKPHKKLLSFNKIYYEMNKKYGFKDANKWLELEWNKALYLHDANSSSFIHYCYKGEEMLTVKYNDNIFDITFAKLYEILEEPEEFDVTINQMVIFPENLFVRDINKNEKIIWTKVIRVVKHSNDKPMRFIKYANGLSQIVTEDHPIITSKGDIPAKEVTTEDLVLSIKPEFYNSNEKSEIYTNEFGWLVGMCLAEGSAQPSSVTLKQTEIAQYEKLLYILNKYHMPYSLDEDNRIRLKVSPLEKIIENMLLGKTSAFKSLPADYNTYPIEFMNGVIAGIIDGDGTIDGYKHRHCQIRIASEELCHQISNYLKQFNIFCRDRTPYIYKGAHSFEQKLPLFGIGFTLTNEEYFMNIGSIKINSLYEPRIRKKGDFKNKRYQYNYGWINVIENTQYIDTCPIVYDITTETGHFICNNILSHNCYAYDLKDLAEKGLFFIDNFNAEPPKHLETFIDFVKEFVGFTSQRSSGACGLPNIIPYMYYFWKKDCESGFTNNPDRYAKQQIQRLVYGLNQPYVRDK